MENLDQDRRLGSHQMNEKDYHRRACINYAQSIAALLADISQAGMHHWNIEESESTVLRESYTILKQIEERLYNAYLSKDWCVIGRPPKSFKLSDIDKYKSAYELAESIGTDESSETNAAPQVDQASIQDARNKARQESIQDIARLRMLPLIDQLTDRGPAMKIVPMFAVNIMQQASDVLRTIGPLNTAGIRNWSDTTHAKK
jgi:hypothetical protein